MARKLTRQPSRREGIYSVVWPKSRKVLQKTGPLGKRFRKLNGKTICMLWNGRYRGDEIFLALEKGLTERNPGIRLVPWTEFPRDGEHGLPDWKAHPNVLAEKACDGVIVATGA